MNKTSQKVYFIAFFVLAGLLFSNIKFSNLVGSNTSFTLFDFMAPVSGSFLGAPLGIISVFTVLLINLLREGSYEMGSLIRLFPTLFAVYYFSLKPSDNKNKLTLIIPMLAMAIFWAHPAGRQAWYFALYWLIPVVAFFWRKNLYLRSLGATFTAHSVGGAAWAWAFNLPASVWQGLIPVVAYERLMFAGGIALSYIVLSKVLSLLVVKKIIPAGLHL